MSLDKIICIVGRTGSGKSTARMIANQYGFFSIELGDFVTKIEANRRKIENLTEAKESIIRAQIRKDDPAVLAKLATKYIDEMNTDKAVISGMVSTAELKYIKEYAAQYGASVVVLAIECSFKNRVEHLSHRTERSYTVAEVQNRDAWGESLGFSKLIESADHTITNNRKIEYFKNELGQFFSQQAKGAGAVV